jgi:hypothetical protein
MCLISVPDSWHRPPTSFEISWMVEATIVIKDYSWWASGWGLVTRKTKSLLEAWNIQPYHLILQQGLIFRLYLLNPA